MNIELKTQNNYPYIDEGKGETLLLLHGLFGALSNWDSVVRRFSKTHRVVIPMLPIYEMPIREAGLDGLVEYLEGFVEMMGLKDFTLMGNSLGGHIALIYTLANKSKVRKMILTGSSGLFENSMGGSFPKRGSYEYIKERVEYTFYDPKTATPDYIEEVFETTKSIPKCMRIVAIAKSAQRHNMAKEVQSIKIPTLLVWGLNDTITPPEVAHEFNRLIPNSTLRFIDKCCHAPMMEHPDKFNDILSEFLLNEAA
ncbi:MULTISPECIES: alpha/beta fold hydrolase [unclassified Imperialibacter]|uniref:alpha/beta fold hydrolase n=1 Tax=unclassified Imperialibacter TaxID=2629706 RepID=UPI001254A31C|nr:MULTISPECIES: alpha/beta hydrolase [unclassified Imperialibacter]CAD5289315.1 Alpha/beta hydrolase [Imperialibacter sp. 89]CAD5289545.1 Alpha/beta hydrolase [Imperialibacter sp. 75]VVT34597.1 Alpha/beta hydrolase [Imperialibacter sp. EC-SDR9]